MLSKRNNNKFSPVYTFLFSTGRTLSSIMILEKSEAWKTFSGHDSSTAVSHKKSSLHSHGDPEGQLAPHQILHVYTETLTTPRSCQVCKGPLLVHMRWVQKLAVSFKNCYDSLTLAQHQEASSVEQDIDQLGCCWICLESHVWYQLRISHVQ